MNRWALARDNLWGSVCRTRFMKATRDLAVGSNFISPKFHSFCGTDGGWAALV